MGRLSHRVLAAKLCVLAFASTGSALGPHEVALVVNRASRDSLEVANHYRQLRDIPLRNIVYVDLPGAGEEAAIAPGDFTRLIWDPVSTTLERRHLQSHIRAWVYSAGFPTRVDTDPPVSITGLTFVRNVLPDKKQVAQGLYASPFFAGPDGPGRPVAPTRSLRIPAGSPLPSMMLGVTGPRGNEMPDILRALRDGVRAEASLPTGTVYFVTSDNVRSKARDWQFPDAAAALKDLGVEAVAGTNRPRHVSGILGIQIGASDPQPWQCGAYRPGSMAEHLTSLGAVFDKDGQTKISKWIRAGATASAGTVTEPRAIWTKFPSAFFFVHYAHGLTMLESFCRSLRCPLQTLLLGEPLAAPWSRPVPLTLLNLAEGPVGETAAFLVRAWGPPPAGEVYTVTFYLDGVPLPGNAGQPSINVDTAGLADGFHSLRAVIETSGPVKRRGHATTSFSISRHGRAVATHRDETVEAGQACTVKVSASGRPRVLRLETAGHTEEQNGASTSAVFTVSAVQAGYGPALVQAVAEYEDGMLVRGEPAILDFTRP